MAYRSSVNTGLPNIPDPPDPAFFPEFTRLYNAIRNLTIALDSYTGALPAETQYYDQTPPSASILTQNSMRLYVKFGVAIAYGQVVHLYNNAGVLTAELASAVNATKPMHGWCSIAGAAGAFGEVMLGGLCSAIGTVGSPLVPGATYFLGNTAGTIAPTAGTSSQKIGYALAINRLFVQPQLI